MLNAPIQVLVCAACSANASCASRYMTYEASRPPKITISDAMIHHTARRPVGIPALVRPVAIGRLAEVNAPPRP